MLSRISAGIRREQAGRRGWSHRKESFTALRPLMRKLTLILNQNWVVLGQALLGICVDSEIGRRCKEMNFPEQNKRPGWCPSITPESHRCTQFVPARERGDSASVARTYLSLWLRHLCIRYFFFFFNQHALSDSFIIVFNSLKSLFALEERIKKIV